jgi:eukaryotic-like serine/threonine-protein kinase
MTGAHGAREADVGWTDRPAEDVHAGAILGGKYRLISEIGRGGMGSVWRAEHMGWDAPVALKLMNRDITAHPEAIVRFEREVRLAAGLRSPHVVQVLDHGVDMETSTPFIAMELLEGESLARRVKRSCLSPAETFDVFSQLVRALSRAHAAGIVHRDLKPDNVFLVKNEEESLVKVLDFGVAKWTSPDLVESGLTRPGSVVGTPFYMSPEQIQGSREIDHRADLWALAAIACECLTGRRPFEAPDFAQLAVLLLGNVRRPVPSSFGPVPHGFDAWFARATDPDIRLRFQSAREMAQSLAAICDVAPSSGGEPYHSSRSQTMTRQEPQSMAPVVNTAYQRSLPTQSWQRPMAKLVGSTVVATLVVLGVVGYWITSRETRSAETRSPETRSPETHPRETSPPPPAETHATGTTKTISQGPTGSPPKVSGPGVGIRPIHESNGPASAHGVAVPPADESPRDGSSADGAASDGTASDRPRGAPVDDFDRAAAERRVRAALLDRARIMSPKPRRARASATRGANGEPARPNAGSAPVAERPAPTPPNPPEGAASPAATKPPAEPAPKVVDGRRIRTSL